MFVRYPPGRIRYEGDQPVALLGVRVPGRSRGRPARLACRRRRPVLERVRKG
jgi:hypothetical protein